jgi:hypothetical protein
MELVLRSGGRLLPGLPCAARSARWHWTLEANISVDRLLADAESDGCRLDPRYVGRSMMPEAAHQPRTQPHPRPFTTTTWEACPQLTSGATTARGDLGEIWGLLSRSCWIESQTQHSSGGQIDDAQVRGFALLAGGAW